MKRAVAGKESQTVEGLRCQIVGVHVGLVPVSATLGVADSNEAHLVIALRLTNTDRNRKFEYRSWGESLADNTLLADEHGNRYQAVKFKGFATPVGRTSSSTIYSDSPVADVLVYERPVPGAESLDLDLPLPSFGKGVGFHFRIPRSAWEPPPSPSPGRPAGVADNQTVAPSPPPPPKGRFDAGDRVRALRAGGDVTVGADEGTMREYVAARGAGPRVEVLRKARRLTSVSTGAKGVAVAADEPAAEFVRVRLTAGEWAGREVYGLPRDWIKD